jgi:hypothetical protein
MCYLRVLWHVTYEVFGESGSTHDTTRDDDENILENIHSQSNERRCQEPMAGLFVVSQDNTTSILCRMCSKLLLALALSHDINMASFFSLSPDLQHTLSLLSP